MLPRPTPPQQRELLAFVMRISTKWGYQHTSEGKTRIRVPIFSGHLTMAL